MARVGQQGNRVGHKAADYFHDQKQRGEQKGDPKTAHGRVRDVGMTNAAMSVRTAVLVPML
jgi:hypothetical protein